MIVENWVSVLLLHLVRCPRTIDVGKDKVTPEDIAYVYGSHKAIFWAFSRDYYLKYGKVIPRHTLEYEVITYVKGLAGLDGYSTDEMVHFIEWLFTVDEKDLNPEEAVGFMESLLQQTRVRAPVQAALDGGQNVEDILDIMNAGADHANMTYAEAIDPLACIEEFVGAMAPDPSGGAEINYFNTLLQGGIRPGEIAVVMGPMGGFKTTMAVDVCCAMAKVREYSMFCAYEQAYKTGDLPIRFLSRMAGIPKHEAEKMAIASFSEEDRQKVITAKQFSPYMLFMDRSRHVDKVSDIGAFVKANQERGRHPRIIFIDQLMTWVSKWDGVTESNLRHIMRDVIDDLKHNVAEKYGTAIIVLHQLTAALAGGSSTKIPNHTNSQECKQVCNWADFGIAMGNVDKDMGVMWIAASKTRRGMYTQVLVRPDGAYCHLRLDKDVALSKDKTKFVKHNEPTNKIPNEMMGKETLDEDEPTPIGTSYTDLNRSTIT